jgi:hypothetical protein
LTLSKTERRYVTDGKNVGMEHSSTVFDAEKKYQTLCIARADHKAAAQFYSSVEFPVNGSKRVYHCSTKSSWKRQAANERTVSKDWGGRVMDDFIYQRLMMLGKRKH